MRADYEFRIYVEADSQEEAYDIFSDCNQDKINIHHIEKVKGAENEKQ